MKSYRRENLIRQIEPLVIDYANFPKDRYWFVVDEIEVRGRPIEGNRVWATLHFIDTSKPYCCGEPGCHFSWWQHQGAIAVELRRDMKLQQEVWVEFVDLGVNYNCGVRFITIS